jgi:hypothetical protein
VPRCHGATTLSLIELNGTATTRSMFIHRFYFCVQTKALKFEENVSKKFGWDFSAVPEDEAPVLVTSIFHENME